MKKFSSTMRANSRRTSRSKSLILFGLLAGVFLFVLTLIPSAVSTIATVLMTPIDGITSWIRHSESALPTYVRDRDLLNEEIEQLHQEIAALQQNELTVRTLRHENTVLRNLMGTLEHPRLIANVIARPPELPYDLLQIDQGSERGVQVGAPVFLGYNQIIGIISHTSKTTAFVELLTNHGFESTVYIYGPDIFTKAEGYGGGILRVSVPQGITLEEGNVVIVPALRSGIYGTIGHIQTAPTQAEQYGFVIPTTPLQSIHKVAVGARPVDTIDYETAQQIVTDNRVGSLDIDVPKNLLVVPATSTTATSTDNESLE